MIAEALKARPRAEWLELMEKAGVPCAAVNDIGELARTEQMEASKLIQQLPGRTEGGRPADLLRPCAAAFAALRANTR